ncbi:hypothetical protein PAECIP111891_06017 [Paenibacillus allorhizoplanae]|uniref:Uncharacterized protein n=1 Tax=Paenibacillus allorhizoplanae TaxID=2905648 RepID=A0ABN8H3L4_9BACL|nr:hypothetical protein PAECIP111891_06017 [Paenibacillus allorhizoplanae]
MITLDLMNSTEFQDYLNSAIKSYAKSNVQSGNWNEKESISKATEQYAHLLPDGEKTTDNKLFTIRSNGQEVGMIWQASDGRYRKVGKRNWHQEYRTSCLCP